MPRYRLTLVEDAPCPSNAAVLDTIENVDGFECRTLAEPVLEPRAITGRDVDLVVAVATHDPSGATRLLQKLGDAVPVPLFAVLPAEPEESLFRLAARVAEDFVVSPPHERELRQRLLRILAEPSHELARAQERLLDGIGMEQIVGRDRAFVEAIGNLPRFARADMPVLITGETGTGKELCARTLHHLSSRRQMPFIAVDCAALPDPLFESEMFGHVRGAFTDAHRDRRGLVAMAAGGSLFLDEVDALSATSQGKLLRLLQEHEYRPLGSDEPCRANVRVLSATNRRLEEWVRSRNFRPDLYFRLNVLRIQLPPMRERRSDIELLARQALRSCSVAVQSAPHGFTPAAVRRLESHDWPGNVRELYNVVQRAAVTAQGTRIAPGDLDLPGEEPAEQDTRGDFRAERAAAIAAFERRYVEDLLRKHGGNVTHAAREAQQDRRAFGRCIKKHGIDRGAVVRGAGRSDPTSG